MTVPVFVDSNVLIYCHDTANPEKQARASAWIEYLWKSRRGRLSIQVLQEFYVNVTQKVKPGLDRSRARQEISALTAWRPMLNNSFALLAAWDLQDRYDLSLWDSLVVAAAQNSGCGLLLTEDLQHDQDFNGLRVVSPFLESPPDFPP
jgi:predicted nucleic acid-binding protein